MHGPHPRQSYGARIASVEQGGMPGNVPLIAPAAQQAIAMPRKTATMPSKAKVDIQKQTLDYKPLYVGNCVGLGPFLLPLLPPCGGGYGIALKKGNLPIPKTAFLIDQTVSSSTNTMETEISSMLRCRESVGPERLAFHSSRMCMKMVVKGCRWRTASGCRCRPRWWGTACQMLQTLRLKTVVPQARALLSGRYGVDPSIQDWLDLQADKPSLKPG